MPFVRLPSDAVRLAPESSMGLRDWRPLDHAPPPAGCQRCDAGVPWNRADDLTSRWQYRSGLALVVLALAALVLSPLAPRGSRRSVRGSGRSSPPALSRIAVWT